MTHYIVRVGSIIVVTRGHRAGRLDGCATYRMEISSIRGHRREESRGMRVMRLSQWSVESDDIQLISVSEAFCKQSHWIGRVHDTSKRNEGKEGEWRTRWWRGTSPRMLWARRIIYGVISEKSDFEILEAIGAPTTRDTWTSRRRATSWFRRRSSLET